MTCQNCGHGMTEIVPGLFWCQRCGTQADHAGFVTPQLVKRCRRFEAVAMSEDRHLQAMLWHRLGIAEAINLPEGK